MLFWMTIALLVALPPIAALLGAWLRRAYEAIVRSLRPEVIRIEVPVPVIVQVSTPSTPRQMGPSSPQPQRGDLVDLRDTPFYGMVMCVDDTHAWCHVVEKQTGPTTFVFKGQPKSWPIRQLVVVNRGYVISAPN